MCRREKKYPIGVFSSLPIKARRKETPRTSVERIEWNALEHLIRHHVPVQRLIQQIQDLNAPASKLLPPVHRTRVDRRVIVVHRRVDVRRRRWTAGRRRLRLVDRYPAGE